MQQREDRRHPPQDVAERLSVSPSTLRRWSREFADFLSESAGNPGVSSQGEPGHRRYTDQDMATLLTIKGLLTEGLSYEQVKDRLTAEEPEEFGGSEEKAMVSVQGVEGDGSSITPVIGFLADTLQILSNGQQVVLNSQQASRELMGVVLQDNFNLKEENVRLRDQMLDLERELAELRRREEMFREGLRQSLEARIQRLEEERGLGDRAGCLASLLGIFM